ncbi:MAG: 50S ribosomal protein L19 [Patescibacteria group bacterium]
MALKAIHNKVDFGVGDKIKVYQKITEGEKRRTQAFEGIVISIKNRGENKSFTVRKMGVQAIGIERIFPLFSPLIEKIEVTKEGTRGVRRAKLYYIRNKSSQEIDKIFSKAKSKIKTKKASKKK